jgi:hypothetical protein
MKYFLPLLMTVAFAAELKPLPGQAGNDDVELRGSVILEPAEIHEALHADLGPGYIVVRMKVTPKTDKALRVGPDDFTMVSHKDGERSQALDPAQIAGSGAALVVKTNKTQGGGLHSEWFGGALGGGGAAGDPGVDSSIQAGDKKSADNPLLAALKEKGLPDKETQQAVEGLLYFPIEGKVKPKDLSVVYKGPAGRLVMDFENPKKR